MTGKCWPLFHSWEKTATGGLFGTSSLDTCRKCKWRRVKYFSGYDTHVGYYAPEEES